MDGFFVMLPLAKYTYYSCETSIRPLVKCIAALLFSTTKHLEGWKSKLGALKSTGKRRLADQVPQAINRG